MSFIRVENVSKQYGVADNRVLALDGVGFEIEEGEFLSIMGESGSGKSTLLSVMGALAAPSSGSYAVDDMDVYALDQDQQADFRREFLGFVFQSFHLIPYLTVRENVMLPLATTRTKNGAKRVLAQEALDRVGLRGKEGRLPSQISGGEQERVAIARAIVNRPSILLADEPTGNLDSGTSRQVMELLASLNRDGMTVVMVTHSHECARFSRRILRIADGRLVGEERTVKLTATEPVHWEPRGPSPVSGVS